MSTIESAAKRAKQTTIWTRAQREALYKVYMRKTGQDGDVWTWRRSLRGYRGFRRTARLDSLMGCVMVPWCGMWLGIERDGHVHS